MHQVFLAFRAAHSTFRTFRPFGHFRPGPQRRDRPRNGHEWPVARSLYAARMSVRIESDGPVTTVVIDRPEARNAVDGPTATALADAFRAFDADPDQRVAVLTGAGGTFCAGMDLKGFLSGDSPLVEGRGFAGITEGPPKKPIIAAVEGYALAGGFEIALSCDLVVSAETAKFGLPEVRRGLVAGAGGLLRLPRRIPYHLAMEIVLTGGHFTAAQLREFGLLNRVTPEGGALAGAMELAGKIAENAPLSLAASKRVVVESPDWQSDEAFAKQGEIITPVFMSKDAQEGAASFAEKRKPVWSGE
jgi:enoyl-CoA hydratase